MYGRGTPHAHGGRGIFRRGGQDGPRNERYRPAESPNQSRQREARDQGRRGNHHSGPTTHGKPNQHRDRESPLGKSPSAAAAAPAATSSTNTPVATASKDPPRAAQVSSIKTEKDAIVIDPSPPPVVSTPVKSSGNSANKSGTLASAAASNIEPEAGDSKGRTPPQKRKFTNRCRLFVGNLPNGFTESALRDVFIKYGEVSEIYLQSQRNFGFVRLDTRANAEKAKEELDGSSLCNREVRVRFAAPNCSVTVDSLHPMVSNELLEQAFSQFGSIERAIVYSDEKGKSLCKGIVDFARRNSAINCVKACTDGCFILTKTPLPVVVQPVENNDDVDGVGDKTIQGYQNYKEERELEPRFARPGSFEYDIASQWKALSEAEKAQRDLLEKQIREARQQLRTELDQAVMDQQAEKMRLELQRRQEELSRFEEHRRVERAKFAEQQRRHEGQRRDEYFQQQSSIMRQHGPSSKAVETFLRGRHQQLDEMFHGQGPPSDPGVDGLPMPDNSRPGMGPPGMGLPSMGPGNDDGPMDREAFFNRDARPPPPGHHGHDGPAEDDPQWQNIAAAVTHIQAMVKDDRGSGPPLAKRGFHPGEPPHGFHPDGPPPLPKFRPDKPPMGSFQPRGPHSHPGPGHHGPEPRGPLH